LAARDGEAQSGRLLFPPHARLRLVVADHAQVPGRRRNPLFKGVTTANATAETILARMQELVEVAKVTDRTGIGGKSFRGVSA